MEKESISYTEYYKKDLEEYGVALIQDLEDNILGSDSYVTPCLMIALHQRGVLHVQYDLQDKTFTKHKVVILLPEHMISDPWASKDFQRTLLLISPRIFEQLKYTSSYRTHLLYHKEPECELTDEQWDKVLPCVEVLKTIIHAASPNRERMLVNYLDILFELLNSFNVTNRGERFADESNRQIFTRFYELLIEHYKDSRDVKYYADKMCLTPKYFAKLIKHSTGITASDWIDNYVIMQAKTQLKCFQQYSISQISAQLGFTEQSTFCRYFKTRVGLSPSDFRNSNEQ